MKWTHDSGEIKLFNLIAEVSSTWKDAALLLGMNMDSIKNYKQQSDDDVERLEHVMSYWIENCADHSEYPATWQGLVELLIALQRGTAAKRLKECLERRKL